MSTPTIPTKDNNKSLKTPLQGIPPNPISNYVPSLQSNTSNNQPATNNTNVVANTLANPQIPKTQPTEVKLKPPTKPFKTQTEPSKFKTQTEPSRKKQSTNKPEQVVKKPIQNKTTGINAYVDMAIVKMVEDILTLLQSCKSIFSFLKILMCFKMVH